MAARKEKDTGSMSRQQRRLDKKRRAKDRWRKEHMQKRRQKNDEPIREAGGTDI